MKKEEQRGKIEIKDEPIGIVERILDYAPSAIRFIPAIGAVLLGLAATRGCNMFFNNKYINTESHETVSYTTGLNGHVEYTRYSDGSQDVKVYPGIGHKLWDSQLDQDLDGDGLVDRIRRNGAEWKANSLSELLVRDQDYGAHQERFDEADERLKELMRDYSK